MKDASEPRTNGKEEQVCQVNLNSGGAAGNAVNRYAAAAAAAGPGVEKI